MKKINLCKNFKLSTFVKTLAVLVFLPWFSKAQNPQKEIPKSVQELLQKDNPDAYRYLNNKDNFLVVANYRNGKRWKYYEGDLIRFKDKKGNYFEEKVEFISDSTFSVYHFNKNSGLLELYTFEPMDIKATYKYKRGGFMKTALLSMTPFIPMALLDWGLNDIPPNRNTDFLWIAPVVGIGNALIFKHKNLFNKQKLKRNKELKIIKPI